MKVLVLNASPNSSKSNTLKLTNSFIEGLNSTQENKVDFVDLSQQKIDYCTACKTCWTKTPGECKQSDDMTYILNMYVAADLIVWSFPVMNAGIPAKMKTVIDRLLPIYMPYMEKSENDICSRPFRYDFSNKKYVIISTCDYANTRQNYESVLAQFDLLYGKNYQKILCPEGELFAMPQFVAETQKYLDTVKEAGEEFGETGKFANKTTHSLIDLMVEPERFVKISNGCWIINQNNINSTEFEIDPTEKLVRELVVAYNPKSYRKKTILEIHFTDLQKTYQLYLGRTQCTLKTEIFQMYDTRIETTFKILTDICSHELSCSDALNEGNLNVLGDFTTMLKIDDLFGFKEGKFENTDRRPSFLPSMLMPWIALWILGLFAPSVAPIVCIALCAVVPASSLTFKATNYENVTLCAVPILSLFLMLNAPLALVMFFSFFVLGLTFVFSTFRTIPITAHYLAFAFGGYTALDNPVYIKSNKTLSGVLGAVLIVLSVAITILSSMKLTLIAGIIVILSLALVSAFVVLFMKMYPKHLAKGNVPAEPKNSSLKNSGIEKIKKQIEEKKEKQKQIIEEKQQAFINQDFNEPEIAMQQQPVYDRKSGRREQTLAEYKAQQLAKQRRREKMRLPSFSEMKDSVENFFDNLVNR